VFPDPDLRTKSHIRGRIFRCSIRKFSTVGCFLMPLRRVRPRTPIGTAEAAEKQPSQSITWCRGKRKHIIFRGVKLSVVAPLAFRVVFAFYSAAVSFSCILFRAWYCGLTHPRVQSMPFVSQRLLECSPRALYFCKMKSHIGKLNDTSLTPIFHFIW
jgi:hypothetical protein